MSFGTRAFAPTVQGALALEMRYGLDRLARHLEGAREDSYDIDYVGQREVDPLRYAYVTHEGPIDGLPLAVQAQATALRERLANLGVTPTGAAIAVYLRTHTRLRTVQCRIGFPIGDIAVEGLPIAELPAHRASVVRLHGSRTGSEVAWYQALQRMRIDGIRPDPRVPPFERHAMKGDTAGTHCEMVELHMAALQSQPVASPSASAAA